MATDEWIEFDGVEVINLARTVALASAMGIDSVWTNQAKVEWVEDARAGEDYYSVLTAPWYDETYPASAEFAGVVPLSFPGLDDSTTQATTNEYITDGGRSGSQRNSTLPIVASVGLIASSDRGAEYGKRWLDRVLRASGTSKGCNGAQMRYYRWKAADAPVAHRRQVRLTRGTSVTRKRSVECSVTWLATFTLTCDDPFEYGDAVQVLGGLGAGGTTPPDGDVENFGSVAMVQRDCPVYDYSPVFDPLYPALVPSPTAPHFYPDGWNIAEDMTFDRYWARINSPGPHALNVVPLLELTTAVDARRVRVSIFPSYLEVTEQCTPLFSVIVNYVPAGGTTFYVDGEQNASYIWDGFAPIVRRADSLVYGPDAKPVEWAAFNDEDSLLVVLDLFTEGEFIEGDGTLRLNLSFIPKSD